MPRGDKSSYTSKQKRQAEHIEGRGKKVNTAPSKKGGRKGGKASASRSKAARSRSAKKAARTRKRRGH